MTLKGIVAHTALPWHLNGIAIESEDEWIASTDDSVNDNALANVEYIVTACNAYPALVAALEAIRDHGVEVLVWFEGGEEHTSACADCDHKHRIAIAALGAARGGRT